MPGSRETTPSRETDQAHEGQSSVREGKRKWSAERDSRIREPSAGPYSPIRDTSPTQQIDDPRKKARTTLEGNQEQEKDDTALVLDNINVKTMKTLHKALNQLLNNPKSIYRNDAVKKGEMSNLRQSAKIVFEFQEGKKSSSREDAYPAMSRLLTEVPRIDSASTGIKNFLDEAEQIKRSNPEQAEGGISGS